LLFSSSVFLFQFLPLVLFLFYIIKTYRLRLGLLLLSSLVFYAYWNYKYLGLLFLSILIDYYVGIWIDESKVQSKRKRLLILSLVSNLGILFVFKYFNFFIDSVNSLSNYLGVGVGSSLTLSLVLPVGISFYTFQSMSYTIDVYRRKTNAHRDFLAFFTYVSFFPQLIAGPIIRYSDLLPQLESNTNISRFEWKFINQGIYFFVVGLAKKILIADRVGVAIDPLIADLTNVSSLEAWIAMFGYAVQLYFDFSGYSDMAVGLGKFFHLDFPQNFASPYKSKNITEFWRRWHLSLSSWLRDYLYISLGGNRKGPSRTYFNLLTTMLLGGLWHGAGWNFVIWGAMHGGALAFERKLKGLSFSIAVPDFIRTGICFFYVCLAWVFFRAESFDKAIMWFERMFAFDSHTTLNILGRHESRMIVAMIVGLGIAFKAKNTFEKFDSYSKLRFVGMAVLFVFSLMYLRAESVFLYFQF